MNYINSIKKTLVILFILLVASLVVYFGFFSRDSSQSGENRLENEDVNSEVTVGEPDPIFAQPLIYSSLKNLYSGRDYAFNYSQEFKVSLTSISSTEEVTTIENADGSGFQIFSMLWDESEPITPERIWEDEPDAEITDPKNADLDGIKALVFYGYNGDIGETFEVWTVRNGKLFQITGPKTAEKLITETLETWEWR